MSPARLQHQLRILTFAFAFALVAALGFLAGQIIGPNPIESDDLTAAGVNNCVTAIKGSLALLDPDSIVAFDAAEVEELRTLPARCKEEAVLAGLEEEYPELLYRLQTIGRDTDCQHCQD